MIAVQILVRRLDVQHRAEQTQTVDTRVVGKLNGGAVGHVGQQHRTVGLARRGVADKYGRRAAQLNARRHAQRGVNAVDTGRDVDRTARLGGGIQRLLNERSGVVLFAGQRFDGRVVQIRRRLFVAAVADLVFVDIALVVQHDIAALGVNVAVADKCNAA